MRAASQSISVNRRRYREYRSSTPDDASRSSRATRRGWCFVDNRPERSAVTQNFLISPALARAIEKTFIARSFASHFSSSPSPSSAISLEVACPTDPSLSAFVSMVFAPTIFTSQGECAFTGRWCGHRFLPPPTSSRNQSTLAPTFHPPKISSPP